MSATRSISPPYRVGYEYDCRHRPQFSLEPSVEIIERLARQHEGCDIVYLNEGGWNKVYKVDSPERTAVMRVALPVEVPYKVLSEVATIDFLRRRTSIPLPRIFAYDASNENELRFPWILMEYIDGQPLLGEKWRIMPMVKKEARVRRMADIHAELYDLRFDAIGSLLPRCPDSQGRGCSDLVAPKTVSDCGSPVTTTTTIAPADLVTLRLLLGSILLGCVFLPLTTVVALCWTSYSALCQHGQSTITWQNHDRDEQEQEIGRSVYWDSHIALSNASRGPFPTTGQWVATRLAEARAIQCTWDEVYEDDADRNRSERVFRMTDRLIDLAPRVFPPDAIEEMALYPSDLHSGNILIDSDFNLAAIVDWEVVMTMPRWYTCEVPDIFEPFDLWRDPPAAEYYLPAPEDEATPEELIDGLYKDYWDGVVDHEKRLLKEDFLEAMKLRRPEWYRLHVECEEKRQFLRCVEHACAFDVFDTREYEWVDALEQGLPTAYMFPQVYWEDRHLVDPVTLLPLDQLSDGELESDGTFCDTDVGGDDNRAGSEEALEEAAKPHIR